MNKDQALKKCCEILRERVRYTNASITLPGNPDFQDDTSAIREATRLYVETWIVPLINDIERGDWTRIKYYQSYEGHKITNNRESVL